MIVIVTKIQIYMVATKITLTKIKGKPAIKETASKVHVLKKTVKMNAEMDLEDVAILKKVHCKQPGEYALVTYQEKYAEFNP